MPETSYETPPPDDEISLLDLLTTLTENLRLLVLGPILVGVLGLGVAFVLPATFESRLVLRFDAAPKGLSNEAAATLAHSEDVLLALLPSAPWVNQTGSRTVALNDMRGLIQINQNKKDSTLSAITKAPSAAQAQALGQALIAQLREKSLPRGNQLVELQNLERAALAMLTELDQLMPALVKQITGKQADTDNATRSYTLLLQQREAAQRTVAEVKLRLRPFGDEVIVQSPTLPDKPVQPKKGLIAIISGLAAGFCLLLFVLVRQAVRNAAKNPDDASRLATIKANLSRSFFMSGNRPKS